LALVFPLHAFPGSSSLFFSFGSNAAALTFKLALSLFSALLFVFAPLWFLLKLSLSLYLAAILTLYLCPVIGSCFYFLDLGS
jgi:hypothetical protein